MEGADSARFGLLDSESKKVDRSDQPSLVLEIDSLIPRVYIPATVNLFS